MQYEITHTTEYRYDHIVSNCHNIAILKPRILPGQNLLDFTIDIQPKPSELVERPDFFGNAMSYFSLQVPHEKLIVRSKSRLEKSNEISIDNGGDFKEMTIRQALDALKSLDADILDARQYILESPLIKRDNPDILNYALKTFSKDIKVYDACYELMGRIHNDFNFVSGFTNITTPLAVVMKEKKGVCQDFAHLAISCLRSVGLPARYISGYIETLPPPGRQKLVGADASHAWFSVFLPGYGWFDFDPTNNQIPGSQHLLLGWGRDYYDVPPLRGVIFSSGKNTMYVSVDVKRLIQN